MPETLILCNINTRCVVDINTIQIIQVPFLRCNGNYSFVLICDKTTGIVKVHSLSSFSQLGYADQIIWQIRYIEDIMDLAPFRYTIWRYSLNLTTPLAVASKRWPSPSITYCVFLSDLSSVNICSSLQIWHNAPESMIQWFGFNVHFAVNTWLVVTSPMSLSESLSVTSTLFITWFFSLCLSFVLTEYCLVLSDEWSTCSGQLHCTPPVLWQR